MHLSAIFVQRDWHMPDQRWRRSTSGVSSILQGRFRRVDEVRGSRRDYEAVVFSLSFNAHRLDLKALRLADANAGQEEDEGGG